MSKDNDNESNKPNDSDNHTEESKPDNNLIHDEDGAPRLIPRDIVELGEDPENLEKKVVDIEETKDEE